MKKYLGKIILVIAIAIPVYFYVGISMYENRKFNGSNAVYFMRGYIFLQEKHYKTYGSYIDNYRNLYYGGLEKGSPIDKILIDKSMAQKSFADAYIIDNILAKTPTMGEHSKSPVAFKGYFFQEDILGSLSTDIEANNVAFLAIPAEAGKTGIDVFWIDINGKVKYHKPNVRNGTKAVELLGLYIYNTPLNKNCSLEWTTID